MYAGKTGVSPYVELVPYCSFSIHHPLERTNTVSRAPRTTIDGLRRAHEG